MFHKFLNSLKRPGNVNLIEAIQEGYKNIFFESPAAEVIINNRLKFIDFHIEDYLAIYGEEKTLEYVNDLIRKIQNNETIEVDPKFTRGEEITELPNPRNNISKELRYGKLSELEQILDNLNRYKKSITNRLRQMVPA